MECSETRMVPFNQQDICVFYWKSDALEKRILRMNNFVLVHLESIGKLESGLNDKLSDV